MRPFKLEEYLKRYEFSAPYLLSNSDAETFAMQEIIDMASVDDRRLWENFRLGYTQPYGMPALRECIAKELYPSLKAGNILCLAGAEEGIFAALHILCEPKDHVIVVMPCYQSLYEVPALKKSSITQYWLKEENQWRLDLDDLKKSIRPNTKCIVLNFPHNPTGQVMDQEQWDALVAICDAQGIWIFSDEVYRLLGNPQKPWAKPAAELYPKAFSLGVMSKAFGMAGVRIGWLACQNTQMLEKIKQMKGYLSICNSGPSEVLSLIALKNKKAILERNNEIVQNNLALLDQFFEEYQELFAWVRPQGACIGLVRHKGKEPVELFCQRLLKEKGVLLLPGAVYDIEDQYFRIGFGRKNCAEALKHVKAFLHF